MKLVLRMCYFTPEHETLVAAGEILLYSFSARSYIYPENKGRFRLHQLDVILTHLEVET